MAYKIGLENGDENRSIAWVLGYPGCFAYGSDQEAALAAVPAAIRNYIAWIKAHDSGQSWLPEDGIEVHVDEVWNVYEIDENYDRVEGYYSVNAWFLHDWKPLTEEDVARGLKLLSWSRNDLLDVMQGMDEETLNRTYPGERWSIAGIVQHIAKAEWWYLDRLGLAFSSSSLPEDYMDRLAMVRDHFEHVLQTLTGLVKVVGKDGEIWSPRKMLRRAVWHERDHTQHIQKLLEV